ncbi:MAG: biotin-dependent carboxyltransferase family protein [Desulfobacterota bacterium]|nr:biotin-dependent carboxyltransferase family protein [Thermodesulfobacteriota bacterium]
MERIAAFEVLDPGILTTIQDGGRFGFGQFGVPPSGALDPFSYRAANLLVGNLGNEACLETMLAGLKLKTLQEVTIAITGGDLGPTLNGEPLEMWRTHLLIEGDVLAFKKVRSGCRAYLSIRGGVLVPEVMGSRSTFLTGRFGGLEGRPLKKGDILFRPSIPSPMDRVGLRFPSEWIPTFEKETHLRVLWGPQEDHFTEKGLETFSTATYEVSPQSDRIGLRLLGPSIERRPDVEESIISEGLLPGAIQVPGDGRPIIILNELVTGGYTKIATLLSVDLTRVAQLKPGDRVRFQPVSLDEAHRLLREFESPFEKLRISLPG